MRASDPQPPTPGTAVRSRRRAALAAAVAATSLLIGASGMAQAATPAARSEAAPAVAQYTNLNFNELVQEQDQWCWAATGLSIAQYKGYGRNVSQNSFCLASRGYSSGYCPNQAAELSTVQRGWRALGLSAGTEVNGRVSFATVQSEINADRPIETGVYWTAGGGHARVIYGYDASAGTILFSDPWPSNQRYQEMYYNSYISNSQFYWGGSVYRVGA
ncbi:papain-like cysteine protease family protein [Streptomyces sp. PsTaAH-124]|uniref:papain-like cysteine protease family protein n=1 Tax=Streptomyces sp. PsTaAH-124 TaxID=1157638 RepID=UPI0007C5A600|nr:papain-like cysteine protease family protein [Streptomyces sp. PsTaAH-124]